MSKALIILVMVIVGWVSWTVAPSEKVVYRTKPAPKVQDQTDCVYASLDIPVGHKGYISYGSYAPQVGEVIGLKKDVCDYIVQLNPHQVIDVHYDNLTEIKQ